VLRGLFLQKAGSFWAYLPLQLFPAKPEGSQLGYHILGISLFVSRIYLWYSGNLLQRNSSSTSILHKKPHIVKKAKSKLK
jgi:hypothetical protein